MDIDRLNEQFGIKPKPTPQPTPEPAPDLSLSKWREVIQPDSSYLILGDVGMGKSGLAYWLLEHFAQVYGLTPYTLGVPEAKRDLLPSPVQHLSEPADCAHCEDAIVFVDEADLQLPFEDRKLREHVINFLSLPRHRHQILLLAFHFPRLVLGTYLPFFSAFLHKRPPYLLRFASKGDRCIQGMMEQAEQRFSELAAPEVVRHTYVVAPRLRWQGMLTNPVASFWNQEISRIWAGASVGKSDLTVLNASRDDSEAKRLEAINRLFPPGQVPWDQIIALDHDNTLDQLQWICRDAGLPLGGDKKLLAARIIANRGVMPPEAD